MDGLLALGSLELGRRGGRCSRSRSGSSSSGGGSRGSSGGAWSAGGGRSEDMVRRESEVSEATGKPPLLLAVATVLLATDEPARAVLFLMAGRRGPFGRDGARATAIAIAIGVVGATLAAFGLGSLLGSGAAATIGLGAGLINWEGALARAAARLATVEAGVVCTGLGSVGGGRGGPSSGREGGGLVADASPFARLKQLAAGLLGNIGNVLERWPHGSARGTWLHGGRADLVEGEGEGGIELFHRGGGEDLKGGLHMVRWKEVERSGSGRGLLDARAGHIAHAGQTVVGSSEDAGHLGDIFTIKVGDLQSFDLAEEVLGRSAGVANQLVQEDLQEERASMLFGRKGVHLLEHGSAESTVRVVLHAFKSPGEVLAEAGVA